MQHITAGLSAHFADLPFDPKTKPAHYIEIHVGVLLEHLFVVNQKAHTLDADFWSVYVRTTLGTLPRSL
jgi:hypothetical protein